MTVPDPLTWINCETCSRAVETQRFGLPKTGYFVIDAAKKSPNRQHYFCSLKCLSEMFGNSDA